MRFYFVRARERERRVVLVSFSSGGMRVKVMERGGSWRKYAKRRRERGGMRELEEMGEGGGRGNGKDGGWEEMK